jgi:ribosome-associated toxin RatA of RatAB toxin-antitoxin module
MKDNSKSGPDQTWGKDRYAQSHSMLIPSTPAKCWSVITDFERYTEWTPRLELVKILELYPDGRAKAVEFVIDLFVRKARYVLDYTYDDEKFRLSWTYVEGDPKNIIGEFRFEEYGEGQTYVHYLLDIDIGFALPDKIKDILARRTMREALRTLRDEVLKRD